MSHECGCLTLPVEPTMCRLPLERLIVLCVALVEQSLTAPETLGSTLTSYRLLFGVSSLFPQRRRATSPHSHVLPVHHVPSALKLSVGVPRQRASHLLNSGYGQQAEAVGHTLLRRQQAEALLEGYAVAGPLVVGREARRVRRLGHLALQHLLQSVCPLAVGADNDHEMHLGLTIGVWGFGGTPCGLLILRVSVGPNRFESRTWRNEVPRSLGMAGGFSFLSGGFDVHRSRASRNFCWRGRGGYDRSRERYLPCAVTPDTSKALPRWASTRIPHSIVHERDSLLLWTTLCSWSVPIR